MPNINFLLFILKFHRIHGKPCGNSLTTEFHSWLKFFLNFTILIPADFKHLKLGINLNELKIFSNLPLVLFKLSQNELINPLMLLGFESDYTDFSCL